MVLAGRRPRTVLGCLVACRGPVRPAGLAAWGLPVAWWGGGLPWCGAGCRPSRARRGRGFRRLVSGIPAGKFRYRLVQMAANAGLHVIVVDPAYTCCAARHWLAPLRDHHPTATGHHAAALVIGRRGLGHRARRRATGNQTAPEEAARPAQARPRTTPPPGTAPRKPAIPRGPRQPPGAKTGRPHRTTAGNQAAHDRSGPPASQDYVLLAQ